MTDTMVGLILIFIIVNAAIGFWIAIMITHYGNQLIRFANWYVTQRIKQTKTGSGREVWSIDGLP